MKQPDDYPYIRAWGRLLGSMEYYIDDQIALARKEGAPADATFRSDFGWHTVDELRDEYRKEELHRWVKDYQARRRR